MFRLSTILALIATWGLATAHTIITYPGWRGNNLHTNGTLPQFDADALGQNYIKQNDSYSFPYGMQWMYPCGGMPLSSNRTKWPVRGGAVSIQPGWFQGHIKALFYINMGINGPGEVAPPNMSHAIVPPFQILGPTNEEYEGQFCLPQVPMPTNVSLAVGDNVTLQVVEVAQHGASLYNCVDVTLAEVDDPEITEVTPQNCYNSSNIGFELLFTSASLNNAASSTISSPSVWSLVTVLALVMAATSLL